MQATFRGPSNPLEWILAIAILVVVVARAMTLMTVVIVGVAIAIVVAPVVGWWRRRKGVVPPSAPDPAAQIEEPEGPVVDVEFEVRNDP